MQLRARAKIHLVCGLAMIGAFPISAVDAADEKPAKVRPAKAEPGMVTAFYDIHAWTTPVYDLSLDSSAHSAAFITPANIQTDKFDYRLTGQRYPSGKERTSPTREERIASLVNLIEQTIAPDSWRDAGGNAAMHEIRDILVVRQTPENQTEIAALLQGLKDHQSDTVRTIADWFILPPGELTKALNNPAGHKDDLAPPTVDLASLTLRSPAAPHFHAEMLCLNGQTVSYISGRERSLLAHQTVEVEQNAASVVPFMGNAGAGIAIQVNPIIDRQGRRAVITLFSTYNDPEKPGAPIPVSTTAATQPAVNPVVLPKVSGLVREENVAVQEFRSTARLPLATPVLMGSMTLEPTAKNAQAKELVLILCVQPGE